MNEVVWSKGQYTTQRGHVGPLHVFTIAWKSTRGDPNWVMSCSLPGREGERWRHDDEDVLQLSANRILADWLKEVFGFALPGAAGAMFQSWHVHAEFGGDPDVAREAFDAGWRAREGEYR